jgi:protocatechuate 3,4-dioxygenase beta subunit
VTPGQHLREQVVVLPCEGCEGIFVGLPDTIPPRARIAPEGEPGEPMVITGTVFNQDGDVAPGVIVYAYHTDAEGIYPSVESLRGTEAFRHGRLRGWAQTDQEGHYQFLTIRPGAYPSGSEPEHVHMHVLELDCCTYYLTSIKFAGDPRLSDADRRETEDGRGGNALAEPRRNEDGIWVVTRDIVLGRNVPGYPGGNGRGH